MKRLARELSSLRGETAIYPHSIADVDALAGAMVLRDILKRRGITSSVHLVDTANRQARKVMEALRLPIPSALPATDADNVILVDVSNPDLLGGLQLKGKRIVAIDHHFHSNHVRGYVHVERGAASTCEAIFLLAKEMKVQLNAKQSSLLLAGILSDTAFFAGANAATFPIVAELLKKADYAKTAAFVREEPDMPQKIAVLKAMQRAQYEKAGKGIVAWSNAGSFELGAALALTDAGADFAFVANPKEGRISGAKRAAAKGNIGKIMEKAGRSFGGSGGGHESVGGCRGKPEKTQAALDECLRLSRLLLLANSKIY
ncbi:manganese-dependent inorganic pyrophosphatase [Candidatus Norongarragalina meridionalis]|nr:manganese-dependent inorganic pyrophosphatase [Candidatus Norongarragalina meridionalis]